MRLDEPYQRRRNPTLLPLVDVIFLLLIFFMFSSNLSPFSLLQLTRDRTGAAGAPEASAAAATPSRLSARDVDVMLLVGAGGALRVNGQEVTVETLRPLLAGLRQRGAENLVIAPAAGATVQDLVSALEAGRQSGIPFVAIRQ